MDMPTICEFFGIIIRMYYVDHNPPHFHAYYNEHEAIFHIDTLEMHQGTMPRRARALILEWASEHKEELMTDWKLAANHQPLHRIEPLE